MADFRDSKSLPRRLYRGEQFSADYLLRLTDGLNPYASNDSRIVDDLSHWAFKLACSNTSGRELPAYSAVEIYDAVPGAEAVKGRRATYAGAENVGFTVLPIPTGTSGYIYVNGLHIVRVEDFSAPTDSAQSYPIAERAMCAVDRGNFRMTMNPAGQWRIVAVMDAVAWLSVDSGTKLYCLVQYLGARGGIIVTG